MDDFHVGQNSMWCEPCDILTASGIRSELLNLGLHASDINLKHVTSFLAETIAVNNVNYQVQLMAESCGWYKDNSIYVVGSRGYTNDGVIEIEPLNENMKKPFISGTKEEWVSYFTFVGI
jgi:uncharacterized protein (DUF927 family)